MTKRTQETILVVVSILSLLTFLVVLAVFGFRAEVAKNRDEQRTIRSCVATGKTWTHDEKGWGGCK